METVFLIGKLFIAIAAGILAGFSAVYAFNRIPAKWLCDYGQEPDRGMWGIRIKEVPWTVVFSLVFAASSIKLLSMGWLYLLPAIPTLWILLQVGMADQKYGIIPDQFVIALAVTAFGFIPFHASYQSQLLGALAGGGILFLIGIGGRLFFRKESMGFGDVKLFAAIGLIAGLKGIVIIFMITVFTSAFVFGVGLLSGKIKNGDQKPLGPFIVASTAGYILFKTEMIFLFQYYIS